jgi:hypothetical protein
MIDSTQIQMWMYGKIRKCFWLYAGIAQHISTIFIHKFVSISVRHVVSPEPISETHVMEND